jgi:transposase
MTSEPEEPYTLDQLRQEFSDEGACLEWLKDRRYPGGIHCAVCGKVTSHYRVSARRSYSCSRCGHHMHPTSGTIFHGSPKPLAVWFKAVYLCASRGPSLTAKELAKETGLNYRTALRLLAKIRKRLDRPVWEGDSMDLPLLPGEDGP